MSLTSPPEASQAAIVDLIGGRVWWHRCWRLACKQQVEAQSLPIIHLHSLPQSPSHVDLDPIVSSTSYVVVRHHQRCQLAMIRMATKRSRVRTERAHHGKRGPSKDTWPLPPTLSLRHGISHQRQAAGQRHSGASRLVEFIVSHCFRSFVF